MAVYPTEALMRQARSRPEGTAFIFHEDVWTYHRLADESERVARGLAASGVKAGDRVVLHMMNRPEMLVAYYACFRLGAIAAPLRSAFKFAELAPMLQRLKPVLYIGESALYPNVAPVDAAILPRENRFIVDDVDQTQAVQVVGGSEAGTALEFADPGHGSARSADQHIRDHWSAEIDYAYARYNCGDDRTAAQAFRAFRE